MQTLDPITKPVLLLDEKKTKQNISRLMLKASQAGITLRPHFKTHQSAQIGEWFRDVGITQITVSSPDMALYFAGHGWNNITIAFPLNVRQLSVIADLAAGVSLHLLLDNEAAARKLSTHLTTDVQIWLEIDAGYHRTGLPWHDPDAITAVSQTIHQAPHLHLAGILTHAGNSYKARGKTAVLATHHQTVNRLQSIQQHLRQNGMETLISIGDTPACSLAGSFAGIDEIRPGNFVFYDMMQVQIGACLEEDVSVAVACPVVGKYPARNCIALYGGAIHLSKESLIRDDGQVSYGRIALPTTESWEILPDNNFVYSLSQEHGLVQASPSLMAQIEIGDLLLVIPVHSCLTANLLQSYQTVDGTHIEMAHI